MENFKNAITAAICKQFNESPSEDRSRCRKNMAKEMEQLAVILYRFDEKAKQEDAKIRFFDERI